MLISPFLSQEKRNETLSILFAIIPAMSMIIPMFLSFFIVIMALMAWPEKNKFSPSFGLSSLCLIGFFMWSMVTSLWSPDPQIAIISILRNIGTLGAGFIVFYHMSHHTISNRGWKWMYNSMILAATLLIVIAMSERVFKIFLPNFLPMASSLVIHMDRGTTVMALFLWPMIWELRRQNKTKEIVFLFCYCSISLLLSHDAAAKVSVFLGVIVSLMGLNYFKKMPALLCISSAAMIMLAPLVAHYIPDPSRTIEWRWLEPSAHHRLTIWRFAETVIERNPMIGQGFEASRRVGDGLTLHIADSRGTEREQQLMPLHPHNAPLQIWLETGAIGAVIVALLMMSLGWSLRNFLQREIISEISTLWVICFFVSAVSYGLWQNWWQAAMLLVIALWRGQVSKPIVL
jgi:O-antigen ligase